MTKDIEQAKIYSLLAEKGYDSVKMMIFLAMESMPAGAEQDMLTTIYMSIEATYGLLGNLNATLNKEQ